VEEVRRDVDQVIGELVMERKRPSVEPDVVQMCVPTALEHPVPETPQRPNFLPLEETASPEIPVEVPAPPTSIIKVCFSLLRLT